KDLGRLRRVVGDDDMQSAGGSVGDVAELIRELGPEVQAAPGEWRPLAVDERRDLPSVARGRLTGERAAVEENDADPPFRELQSGREAHGTSADDDDVRRTRHRAAPARSSAS